MDLSLPLIGVLGLVGYNLNRKPNSREYTDKRIKIPASELQNGKTIYESKDYIRIKEDEQSRLNSYYADRNKIIATNRYTATTNNTTSGGQNKIIKNPIDSVSEIKLLDKTEKIHAGPMFKEGGYYSKEVSPKEIKENFDSDVSELSGLKTDFKHTNMQPFFGSNIKQPVDGVSMLDKYNGRNFLSKKEVELKKPINKQQVHGMKPFTQLVDLSRYDPGRFRNNVLPFKQYKEPPIPGEYVRGIDKTVDELRTLNNPKASGLEGRINPGSGNYMRPIDPNFVKNRVSTTYAGDFNGLYPTFSKDTEETYIARHIDDLKYTSKGDVMETSYNMGPGHVTRGEKTRITNDINDKTSTYQPGSHHFELANDWVRNAKKNVSLRDENKQYTYTAYEQERETTNREIIGNAFDSRGNKMRSLDKAKTTNKELSNYSYTPAAHSQREKAPVGREFYNKIHRKQRPTREYFAGGGKLFAPQSNQAHIAQKPKAMVEDYTSPAKMNNLQIPNPSNIGVDTSNNKYQQMETDFTYRLT